MSLTALIWASKPLVFMGFIFLILTYSKIAMAFKLFNN